MLTLPAVIPVVNRRQPQPIPGVLYLVCLLGLLLIAAPALTDDRHYKAEMHQSAWYTQRDAEFCELSHPIPLYGLARFRHTPDQALAFELSAHDAVTAPGFAAISTEHAQWMHVPGGDDITQVSLQPGDTPIRLNHALSLRLLLELEGGMQPTFRYRDWGNAHELIAVQLSNVNFARAMHAFRQCVSLLEDNDATAIARIEVRFALDSAALETHARRQLDRMAESVAADPGVSRVVVTGHADSSGAEDYNLSLSEQRARSVLEYLSGRGVDESLLEVVALGESSASNRHRVPAAQRHVLVEILR